MSTIRFSAHALDQLADRGATKEQVEESIRSGESLPAKKGRLAFRKNFTYTSEWKGRFYATKQVMPIVVQEGADMVVITVYVFYFGEGK